MEDHGAEYALAKLAEEKGISLLELTNEIQTAIDSAYLCETGGRIPTPLELVAYISGQVRNMLRQEQS